MTINGPFPRDSVFRALGHGIVRSGTREAAEETNCEVAGLGGTSDDAIVALANEPASLETAAEAGPLEPYLERVDALEP